MAKPKKTPKQTPKAQVTKPEKKPIPKAIKDPKKHKPQGKKPPKTRWNKLKKHLKDKGHKNIDTKFGTTTPKQQTDIEQADVIREVFNVI